MPKRFFILWYTFIFALLQLGVTVEVHYCGKKASYSVLGIEIGKDCPCPTDHHQHSNGCCHDEAMVLKADTDEVTAHSFYLANSNTDLIATPVIPVFDFTSTAAINNKIIPLPTDSPPGSADKIFLRNRVLLI